MKGFILIIVGVLLGYYIGNKIPYIIPIDYTEYIAIAILASIDAIFGGIVSDMKKKFNTKMFIIGFFTNSFLASFIVWSGNLLGVSLSVAITVVFGIRIFNNFSKIRQILLQKI